ncbi:GNAT family N-acetyltransferase [uncultured Fusobacterium sp.]|uniref:GNAT family N-acetyltransferase n=1 Tax=uncultured Fusobacterium sp. TaxID=159267 RepID=UPI0025919BE3|nr:GNAT family N-acetyltransferase [uncultured Fusobacterium sp.]
MKIRIMILKDKKKINEIVNIHMQAFPNFFLTFLGKNFLRELYKGFLEEENSNLIIAVNSNNIILGFLAYSRDLSGFYKYLVKKHLISFSFYAMIGFFKKPKIFFRLVRSLTYSKEAKRDEKYVELSSIGVMPIKKNSGIGSKLIDYLKQIEFEGYKYIKLETDAINNIYANNFYKKNNFVLTNTYLTREGRKMNEYRFNLMKG